MDVDKHALQLLTDAGILRDDPRGRVRLARLVLQMVHAQLEQGDAAMRHLREPDEPDAAEALLHTTILSINATDRVVAELIPPSITNALWNEEFDRRNASQEGDDG